MSRLAWSDLPASVRAAVSAECGGVTDADHPGVGRQSDFTATLRTDTGHVFCKGVRTDSPKVAMHRHEAGINAFLPSAAPRLLWQVETEGWLVLGFEHVEGGHADLAPGSPDVDATVHAVAELRTPAPASCPVLADQWARLAAWRRLRLRMEVPDQYVAWESRAVDLVRGDSLLHTDIHALNLLIDARVRVVDWAWARQGAHWVDRAFLVIRLIEAGHRPEDAQRLVGTLPEAGATAFAVAVLGIWTYLEHTDPLPHRPPLTAAAQAWVDLRLRADRS